MNNKEYILVIDNGTQSLRAMIFNPSGELLAISKVPFEVAYESPEDGWAEQDVLVYWNALIRACKEILSNPAVNVSSIAGITVTTQRSVLVNLNEKDEALRPAIVWMDKRTVDTVKPIRGWLGWLVKIAGLSGTLKRLISNAESLWIQENQPDVWNNTKRYMFLSGYLNHRLTGQYRDSSASQVGYVPFDYKRKTWLKDGDFRWDLMGISRDLLPDLVSPGEEIGRVTPEASSVTGIPAGLPVIASASDKACEVLGCGGVSPEVLCLGYSSTATVNVFSDRYMDVYPFVPAYPSGISRGYNLEHEVYRGFWLVEWFRHELAQDDEKMSAIKGIPFGEVLERYLEKTPPGADGLIAQPYWTPGIKHPGPEARGCFVGLTDRHTRAHLYRALVEGIAFSLREGKEHLEKRTGVPIKRLVVSGGGASSDGVMRLSAGIFGLKAERSYVSEASGLGAAIIAAVGLGLHKDFDLAIEAMCRSGKSFEPNEADVSHYDRLYKKAYEKIYSGLSPVYRVVTRIADGLE